MIRAMGGTGSARAAPAPRFAQWRRRPLPRSESYRRERGAGLLGLDTGGREKPPPPQPKKRPPAACREREPGIMRLAHDFGAASRCKQSPAWGGLRRGAKLRAL